MVFFLPAGQCILLPRFRIAGALSSHCHSPPPAAPPVSQHVRNKTSTGVLCYVLYLHLSWASPAWGCRVPGDAGRAERGCHVSESERPSRHEYPWQFWAGGRRDLLGQLKINFREIRGYGRIQIHCWKDLRQIPNYCAHLFELLYPPQVNYLCTLLPHLHIYIYIVSPTYQRYI